MVVEKAELAGFVSGMRRLNTGQDPLVEMEVVLHIPMPVSKQVKSSRHQEQPGFMAHELQSVFALQEIKAKV